MISTQSVTTILPTQTQTEHLIEIKLIKYNLISCFKNLEDDLCIYRPPKFHGGWSAKYGWMSMGILV